MTLNVPPRNYFEYISEKHAALFDVTSVMQGNTASFRFNITDEELETGL
jgi:hypothetical protein